MQVLSSSFETTEQQTQFDEYDNLLQDPCAGPLSLTLDFLKHVTSDFSEERVLGRGAFGKVYKGVLKSGKAIAVKRLKIQETTVDDYQYKQEVTNLSRLQHRNIVQLRGYCADTSEVSYSQGNTMALVERRERLLCLEFAPNKSLKEQNLEVSEDGLDWSTRYKIIRGICSGLHYLHMELEHGIVHMDLKPANILFDLVMVPKITDFGISRLLGEDETRIITRSRVGTMGYMAPEYLDHGLITKKADIFSFGVIILELVTGCRSYGPDRNGSTAQFTRDAVKKWRTRLPNAACGLQVSTCISIGLSCVDRNQETRPTAGEILQRLDKVEVILLHAAALVHVSCWLSAFLPCKASSRRLALQNPRSLWSSGRRLWRLNQQAVTRILMVAIGIAAGALILQNPSTAWSCVATTLQLVMAVGATTLKLVKAVGATTLRLVKAVGAAILKLVMTVGAATLNVFMGVVNVLLAIEYVAVVPVLCHYPKECSIRQRFWTVALVLVLLNPYSPWSRVVAIILKVVTAVTLFYTIILALELTIYALMLVIYALRLAVLFDELYRSWR